MNKMLAGVATGIAVAGGIAAFALNPTEPAPDKSGVDEAAAVLGRAADAYAKVVALTDVMRLEIGLPDGSKKKLEVPYTLGAGTDGSVGMPSLQAVAVGSSLYLVREDVGDKYAELDLNGDITTTLDALFDGDAGLPVAFDMRAKRGTDRYLSALGLGLLDRPRLAGYEKIENGTPHGIHKLALAAENGSGSVHIDGATHLLSRLDVEARSPDDPESVFTAKVTFAPKVRTSPLDLVTFDPGNRRRVTSLMKLQPTPAAVGQPAPDFTLETLDGRTVALKDLRGSVVVIDFWATWCRPCIMGLPLLDEFADWARASEHPIEVFAINTFENGPEDRVAERVASFWESRKFSMPTLMDRGSAVVGRFGIQSIPTSYVINADGVIAKIHQGFDPGMAKKLQHEVLELLE